MDIQNTLAHILENSLKKTAQGLSLTKLQGEASYRIYYRLALADGSSFIVMQMPAGKSSVSEEITNLTSKPTELPFVNVDRYLAKIGLPVPKIHYCNETEGILILEDFGDDTFEKHILKSDESGKEAWYQRAINLLIEFQEKTKNKANDCIAFERSFDATLLNWELDHFFEYGIEVRLGTKINEQDRQAIAKETQKITAYLLKLPQVLVHRDFQSRNLMVQNDTLKLIDFQDALMGPLPYDLVALLRDSYISLPEPLLDRLTRYFFEKKKKETSLSFEEFQKAFDLMTLQRKLKDTGRFVYIDRVKKNPSFLKHIPDSLKYLQRAFDRQPEFHPLFNLLKKYVPEFKNPL